LTERKPPPTGVVIGPLSATPFARIAPVLLHHVRAGVLHVPVELDAGRLEDAAGRLGELGAGPVARNQGDSVRHGRSD
jgi:hypothetical protein